MKGVRETFTRYDTADYLRTEADIAAYLEACAEEASTMHPSCSRHWARSHVRAT